MLLTNSSTIEIDLVNSNMNPTNNEFEHMINEFSAKMFNNLKKSNIDRKLILEATITITGYKNESTRQLGQLSPNRIQCKITIIDDFNKTYNCETNTWCRKHNKLCESKSTRTYTKRNDT